MTHDEFQMTKPESAKVVSGSRIFSRLGSRHAFVIRHLVFVSFSLTIGHRSLAAHGLVQTPDGKTFEGEIWLETGAFVIGNTNNATTNRVTLENLALLRLPPASAFAAPLTNAAAGPTTNGLLGLYYNSPDLSGDFKIRYDATIDFDWGQGAPFTGINPERFSVRWLGQVVPQFSEHYTFHTTTDNGVRLWVNNRLIIDAWKEESLRRASVPMVLTAGEKYDLRMDMFDRSGPATAKLSWSSPSTPISIIPASQLLPAPAPDRASLASAKQEIPAGVMLTGGSIIARKVHSADDSSVRLSDWAKEPALSTVNVARILCQPLTPELAAGLQPGRAGLLLSNRDFIDGDFRGFSQGKIKMSSVLFGIRNYDAGQVIAVVLRDLRPAPANYELRTQDRSVLLANELHVEKDFITVRDAALVGFRIAATNLVEITRGE
jgi:hypothetical protein